MGAVSQEARNEIVAALRERYAVASKAEKGRILDEFATLSGCHRKHAIRLLKKAKPKTSAHKVAVIMTKRLESSMFMGPV